MKRPWTSGLLVVALFALCPVAHARPVDPTWIARFWDNDDQDILVFRFTSMAGAADMNLDLALLSMPVAGPVASLELQSISVRTCAAAVSREPPVIT